MDHWFLRIQSFIIHLTLLDQQLPEALNWMFNSAADVNYFNSCSDVSLDYSNSIPALTSATLFLPNYFTTVYFFQ